MRKGTLREDKNVDRRLVSHRGIKSVVTLHGQSRAKDAGAGLADVRAKFLLVLLCLLWGINWTVMKIALQEIPPLSMRTISSAFGALTLLGICALSRRNL